MDPPDPFVKIGAPAAVDAPQPLGFVADSVGVDQIDYDPQPHAVSGIDQSFELLRGAETVGNGKEVRHMIAETGVVGVVHHRHQLQRVIPPGNDFGQDLFPEFVEGADFFLFLRHTDVGFVDQHTLRADGGGIFEGVLFLRFPNHSGEKFALFILTDFAGKGGDTQSGASGPLHQHGVVHTVAEGVQGEFYLFDAVLQIFKAELLFDLPVGKIPHQSDGVGIGRPFSEDPLVLFTVESEIFMSGSELLYGALAAGQLLQQFFNVLPPGGDGGGKGFKARIAPKRDRNIQAEIFLHRSP